MASLKEAFATAVNNALENPVPVIQDSEGLVRSKVLKPKHEVYGEVETQTVEEYAQEMDEEDNEIAESMDTKSQEGEDEQSLMFPAPSVDVPYWFESYDQLATTVLANVFENEAIKSVNASFFGDVLKNTSPTGFSRVMFGKHEFLVQDKSDRIVYVFEFLTKAKESLMNDRYYECPMVDPVVIYGSTAYSLVLTPKELMDLQRSYPTYQITFKNSENIAELKLVIRVT